MFSLGKHGFSHRKSALCACLVERQYFRRVAFQVMDAVLVGRVRGKPLGRLTAAELLHLLPESDRSARIVSGARGQLDADAVGLLLGGARLRQVEGYVGHRSCEALAEVANAEER